MAHLRFTRLEFTNFKAFRKFSVPLDHVNVLVGPNNSGKSTVIAAFRTLEVALRRARSRKPERLVDAPGQPIGYPLSLNLLPISTENIATDYDEVEAQISFRLSNGNKLQIHFPLSRQFYLVAETPRGQPRTPAEFKSAFPIEVIPVPQLGPVEHEEELVEEETVRSSLSTHRASRHFRNYWRYYPEKFSQFAELVRSTWPGMEVEHPELVPGRIPTLTMFCQEQRATRELFWAGVGFQIWCQLLTHFIRADGATLLIVDEPEIYLHPDVQRQLLGLLRKRDVDVLLATHSTEIIGEADPEEILLVEKTKPMARRVRDVEGIQHALNAIGSIHNITLAQLARTRRLIFTEGTYDFKIIRRYASILGYEELAAGAGATHVESDGFSSWERIRDFAWGLQKTVGEALRIAAVFDRDYYPSEQISAHMASLQTHVAVAAVLARKEIENYLLLPNALQKAVDRACSELERTRGQAAIPFDVRAALLDITDPMKASVQGSYLGRRWEWLRSSGRDIGSVNRETIEWFDQRWESLESRLEIVPGKQVLGALRDRVKAKTGANLTDNRILGSIKTDEIPSDMAELVRGLDNFRKEPNASDGASPRAGAG